MFRAGCGTCPAAPSRCGRRTGSQFGQDAGRAGAQLGGKGVGSARITVLPSRPWMRNLYISPSCRPGTKPFQMPVSARCMGTPGPQPSKPPQISTATALGAHTANRQPSGRMRTQCAVGVKAVAQKERTIDRRKFHAKTPFLFTALPPPPLLRNAASQSGRVWQFMQTRSGLRG